MTVLYVFVIIKRGPNSLDLLREAGWQSGGRLCIMAGPTRHLVQELNAGTVSNGTRSNQRMLRTTGHTVQATVILDKCSEY